MRELKESDIPILNTIAAESGFEYPSLPGATMEAVFVVVDDQDRPLMACAAEKILQLYLWKGKLEHPAVGLAALRLLHEGMGPKLRERGWLEANVFLPPSVAVQFGRRLQRSFGWLPNWPSFFKKV